MKRQKWPWLLGLGALLACGKSVSDAAVDGSAGSAGQSGSNGVAAGAGGAGVEPSGGMITPRTPALSGSGGSPDDGGMAEAELGGAVGNSEGGSSQRCEPPEPDEQCIQDRQLTLAPFVIVDQDGDGRVEAGENVVLQGQLFNPGPEPHHHYPGVLFRVSDPTVEPAMGSWHDSYALFVGDSLSFELSFAMPDDARVGATISIEAWPSGLNAQPSCCGSHVRKVELVVE